MLQYLRKDYRIHGIKKRDQCWLATHLNLHFKGKLNELLLLQKKQKTLVECAAEEPVNLFLDIPFHGQRGLESPVGD